MDFLKLVQERQSVRGYSEEKVSREKIKSCLEAARLAPSACNAQPWRFIVVDDKHLTAAVAKKCTGLLPINRFAITAPVIIVLLVEPSTLPARLGGWLKDRPFHYVDLGIAAGNLCLQATALGLGTCILGWFQEEGIKEILSIPKEKRIGLLITLGYPAAEEIREKKRHSLSYLCSFNGFGGEERE